MEFVEQAKVQVAAILDDVAAKALEAGKAELPPPLPPVDGEGQPVLDLEALKAEAKAEAKAELKAELKAAYLAQQVAETEGETGFGALLD